MCRFVGWIGRERYLEDRVFVPEHSLVDQSRNALICKTPVNADGFGLAWYNNREKPCLYKDTHPAWSDPNLKQISHQTKARLFLAHVRASTGTATSRDNCHPFSYANWSYMHNGQVGGQTKIRKNIDALIGEQFYAHRHGATESEAIFLIAMGLGLLEQPITAMANAVRMVENLSRDKGNAPHMRFGACWSDGEKIYAARYASDKFAPSLCYLKTDEGVIVVSEPLSSDDGEWTYVEADEAIIVSSEGVTHTKFSLAEPIDEINSASITATVTR